MDINSNSMIFVIGLFFALELFEANWQHSKTLYGILENNYKIYKKSVFLYFLMNPTFFFSLYITISYNIFNIYMDIVIVLKFLDIAFRLNLMKKITNNEDIKRIIPFNIDMSGLMSYINVVLYVPMILFALWR